MIVIGDAAHAPSPSSGQGASLSVEDAVQLARYLRDVPEPSQAFAGFVHARRSRVEGIIKQAARINSNKAATGVARVLRDLMLPVVLLKVFANNRQQQQVYTYNIDWAASSAAA